MCLWLALFGEKISTLHSTAPKIKNQTLLQKVILISKNESTKSLFDLTHKTPIKSASFFMREDIENDKNGLSSKKVFL